LLMTHKKERDDFYGKVYRVVDEIPFGCVTTYGAIARYLGVESGARMVGYALNNLAGRDDSEAIPAHRVVNRLGQLSGRAWFPDDTMREKLMQEGVEFIDEYQIDLERYYWDPEELRKRDSQKENHS